jgi:enoyl-CoA hydratase/carnithine racemase
LIHANNQEGVGCVVIISEVGISVIPAVMAVVCVPKFGRHHAMKLFLTGERFNGHDALSVGWVHRAVETGELVQTIQLSRKKCA